MKRFFVFWVAYMAIALVSGCGNMESESLSNSVSISEEAYDLQSDKMTLIGAFPSTGLVTMAVVDESELAEFEQAFNNMEIGPIYAEKSDGSHKTIFSFYKDGEFVMGYMFTAGNMDELIHEDGTTSLVVYNGKSPMELFEQSTTEKHPAFIER